MNGKAFSIAIKGRGPHMGMYVTYGTTRWPNATFYDRTPLVNAFRQQEADLGKAGYLDAAGTASAKRTAQNLASPPKDDVTLEFVDKNGHLTVVVTCANKRQTNVTIRLEDIMRPNYGNGFAPIDNAIGGCTGPATFV